MRIRRRLGGISARRPVRIPEFARGRRRLGLLLVIAVLLAAVVIVLVSSGSGEPGPATGAAAVVPDDALAYIHISTDARRPAVKRALSLGDRFPDYGILATSVTSRLNAIAGGGSPGTQFSTDIRPWLGKEAAIALLNTQTTTAGSLVVLDVGNRRLCQQFLARTAPQPIGSYDGVQLLRYPTGTELAFVRHYLVLGQDSSVRESIDAATGRSPSLQSSSDYQHAAAGEPNDRVIDAYASASGLQRLLIGQGGFLAALGALLYQPSLIGTTVSFSAVGGGLRVRVHSALNPDAARLNGASSNQFSPTLPQVIPSGATLLLDVRGLDRVAPRVLTAGADGGVAGRIGPLLSRLGSALTSEGVNVQSIVSLFDGETAVAIVPGASSKASTLLIVARTSNEAATRSTLASLELPLEELFPAPTAGPGGAPVFNDRQVAGVTAHQLQLAPGLQLDYAVFGGMVVVSTSLDGIAAVVRRTRSLADEPAYKTTLQDRPDQVTSLLFLDFSQLLSLGEQTGFTRSALFEAIRPDLQKVRAIGLSSTSGEADTTAELFLQIS